MTAQQEHIERNNLYVGDPSSQVAVLCGWKDLTALNLDWKEVGARLAGNLYTARGIDELIRGLFLFPEIRYIVTWGPDAQRAQRMLAQAFNGGKIPSLEWTVPPWAVFIASERVKVLKAGRTQADMRDLVRSLNQKIKQAGGLEPFWPQPVEFPRPEPELPETTTGNHTGRLVQASTLTEAWVTLVQRVLAHGYNKGSAHTTAGQRELQGVMVKVHGGLAPSTALPKELGLDTTVLRSLQGKILRPDPPEEGTAYEPGHRLRTYFATDQISRAVEVLTSSPDSRRVVLSAWDPAVDMDQSNPPCLINWVANVTGNQLHLTVHARSQDVFKAWPLDMVEAAELHHELARLTGLEPGDLISIINSAHIYNEDLERAQRMVDDRQEVLYRLVYDPAGNFLVSWDDGQVVLRLVDHEGIRTLWQGRGTAASLSADVAALGLTDLPAHLMYVARELQRAEIERDQYIQDRA